MGVVFHIQEFAAFRAFELEVVALLEIKAHAAVAADIEVCCFFAGESFFKALKFVFLQLFDEVFDAFLVECPVINVPSFFLVFFADKAHEVIVI